MFTKEFWLKTLERAVKTFAQTLVASGIVFTATANDWTNALIAAALASAFSVITSVASISVGDKGTPSLVGTPEPEVVKVEGYNGESPLPPVLAGPTIVEPDPAALDAARPPEGPLS